MAEGESTDLHAVPHGVSVVWIGPDRARELRLLRAGGLKVDAVGTLDAALGSRGPECLGFALGPAQWRPSLRRVGLADGLATAVGFADTFAFAGGLPAAFGFNSRVGGIVAAIREATGRRRIGGRAAILGSGPESWAALAALVQLGLAPVAYVRARDATTGALAHRLGIDLPVLPIDAWRGAQDVVYDAREPSFHAPETTVDPSAIALHTVAAQLRLFTSREPDMETLRTASCG